MKELLIRSWSQPWSLSLAAGILLGLSFPPFPFPLLIIPAFLLLFRLAEISTSYRQLAYYSYPAFVIWNIIVSYWLVFATVAGGVAAIIANAVLMTIPLVFMKYILQTFRSKNISSLLIASVWVSYEFLHHRWDLSWPWLTLGNAFSNATHFVQYISFTGSLGISFWIILTAALLWFWLKEKKKVQLWTASAAFLLPVFISLGLYISFDHESQKAGTLPVAIVQPNYDSYLDLAGYSNPYDPLNELLMYTDSLLQQDSAAIVYWPENALQRYIIQDNPSQMDRMIMEYVNDWQIPLITGSSFIKLYDEEPTLSRGNLAGKPYNVYNAALGFYPDQDFQFYEKAKLVPIVERMPFVETLQKIDFISNYDWGRNSGFGRGSFPTVFESASSKSPAMVCYDSVFPDWVRQFTNQGADYLTVITNDGWWGNTSGHIQHFDYARLRAIENRRTVLRSANNGISGVILANGDVVIATEYWTRDGFVYDVPLYDHNTFYVRFGDWLGLVSLFATLVLMTFMGYERFIK